MQHLQDTCLRAHQALPAMQPLRVAVRSSLPVAEQLHWCDELQSLHQDACVGNFCDSLSRDLRACLLSSQGELLALLIELLQANLGPLGC